MDWLHFITVVAQIVVVAIVVGTLALTAAAIREVIKGRR